MSNTVRVAIDGPVGAGKSTIAREAANRLGFIYIDTGALYRAIGVFCGDNDVESILPDIKIELRFIGGSQRVFVNGIDYTGKIRTPEASMRASRVSANKKVREFLLDLQRSFAENNSVIMDGRDIGTVVLPDAEVKIFLTASPEERAGRRYDELVQKGENVDYDSVLADLIRRDHNDSHREHAPLKQADDAVLLDTTGNTFEKSVNEILGIIKGKIYGVN